MSVQNDHGLSFDGRHDSAVLRTDEMTLIQSVSNHGLLANFVAAVVTAIAAAHIADLTHVLIWISCMMVAIALRYLLYVAYKRAAASLRADQYWGRIVTGSNLLIGAGWGWAGYMFFGGNHSAAETTLILAIAVAAASEIGRAHV